MATVGYRILDEPAPSQLGRWAVNPFWPLVGLMLVGGWLAWPWFVFNSLALGSATRQREIGLVVGGLLAPLGLLFGLSLLERQLGLPSGYGPYVGIGISVLRLAFAYPLFIRQEVSFALFEHFEHKPINGVYVLILGALVDTTVTELLRASHGLLAALLG